MEVGGGAYNGRYIYIIIRGEEGRLKEISISWMGVVRERVKGVVYCLLLPLIRCHETLLGGVVGINPLIIAEKLIIYHLPKHFIHQDGSIIIGVLFIRRK